MKKATCTLKGVGPYSQCRFYHMDKKPKELHEDFERRTWRERAHYNSKTLEIFIPSSQLSCCIKEAAKYLSIQIPGKGKATFTKHFSAGVGVWKYPGYPIGINRDEVEGETMPVPSGGSQGGGRVMKTFPVITEWEIIVEFRILDDIITPDIFEHVLRTAGTLIGIGRYRPRNGGSYGRFTVKDIKWEEEGGQYV